MKKINTIHHNKKEICENTVPFNITNIILSEKDLEILIPNYKIKNIHLFRNAFVHKSYCTMKNTNFYNSNINCPDNCIPLQDMSYERLEFLGDSILGAVIAKYMYDRFPNQNEGFLSKMKTKIVNGKMLGFLAEQINFNKFAIISKQVEDVNGRNNFKIMEDILEAFIGALFEDSEDYEITNRWIIDLIEEHVDFSEIISTNTNHKDSLLSYMQSHFQDVPKFLEVNSIIKNNCKIFTYIIKDRDNNVIGTGDGNTKKDAENNSSLNALQNYGI
jgi:ribonuclease-3